MLQLPHDRDASLAEGRRGKDGVQRVRVFLNLFIHVIECLSRLLDVVSITSFMARLVPSL